MQEVKNHTTAILIAMLKINASFSPKLSLSSISSYLYLVEIEKATKLEAS